MLISTKGRYALRVMIDLAEHQGEGFIPLKIIARRQEISEKYLENIIKLLVRAKLLNGLRGKGGGYQLTKAPEQYTVGAILRLTEDSSLMHGGRCRSLPKGGQVPHASHLAGAGAGHQRLSGSYHPRRPDAARPERK